MIRSEDQLPHETTYPHLAQFLRSGGTMDVGEDFSTGGFVRLRKGNTINIVSSAFEDLTAALKELNSMARNRLEREGSGKGVP